MKIPKRFKLLGHTIEVTEDAGAFYEKQTYGRCSYEGKWIKLTPKDQNHPITQGSLEQTFLHELLHMCFYHTEQAKLNENEAFIDLLAALLHQALESMEYDERSSSGKTP